MGLGVPGGDRRPLGSLGVLGRGEIGLGLKQATEQVSRPLLCLGQLLRAAASCGGLGSSWG